MKKLVYMTMLLFGAMTATTFMSCEQEGFDGGNTDKVAAIGVVEAVYNASPSQHMEIKMTNGTPVKITPFIMPQSAKNKSVTYSNKHPELLKVGADGLLTPLAVGTDTLTISATDGSGVYTNFWVVIK